MFVDAAAWADAGRLGESRKVGDVDWSRFRSLVRLKSEVCADREAVCAGAISQNESARGLGLGLWEFCASLNCEFGPETWK